MPIYKFVVVVEVNAEDYETAHEALKLDLEAASLYTSNKQQNQYSWTWYVEDEVSGQE